MYVKSISQCQPLIANDGCRIFELLHPENDTLSLPYSVAIAELRPQQSSYRHRLAQVEVYYVLDGCGVMHIDNEAQTVQVGDAVLIPARAVQWIENTGTGHLRFMAIVSPPWSADQDERL